MFEPAHECLDHLDSVPIIVVATVDAGSETTIGKPLTVKSIPVGPIQLLRVDVNVENVLKGDVPLGKSQVFYYGAAYPHGPNASGFSFRDLLFLRRERGQLRMGTDITAGCSVVVSSGAHPGFRPDPKQPLQDTLIDVLLSRGDGATDIAMIRAIFNWGASRISLRYTAKSLLRLATSDTPVVRKAACLEFRDIVVQAGLKDRENDPPLAGEFGIDSSELAKWRRQYLQNGRAKDWWGHDFAYERLPPTLMPAGSTMGGLELCKNDRALGIPPLRPATRAHQP